jgi:hypothetical protein
MQFDADEALVPPPSPHPGYQFDATADETPPSSPAPETVEPSVDEPNEEESAERIEPVAPKEFDPRYRQSFLGVMFIGYLENEFEFSHHKFRIATPSRRERMQIGLAIQEYKDAPTWELAWQAAVVAAFLLAIDDEPLPEPVVKNSKLTAYTERFNWVIDNLYEPVIDHVYTKCFELWGEVDKVMEGMGKALG